MIKAHKKIQLKNSCASYQELRKDLKSKFYGQLASSMRNKNRFAQEVESFLREMEREVVSMKICQQFQDPLKACLFMNELLRYMIASFDELIYRPESFYSKASFDVRYLFFNEDRFDEKLKIEGFVGRYNQRYYVLLNSGKKAFGKVVVQGFRMLPLCLAYPVIYPFLRVRM